MFVSVEYLGASSPVPTVRVVARSVPHGPRCIYWSGTSILRHGCLDEAVLVAWENQYGRLPVGVYWYMMVSDLNSFLPLEYYRTRQDPRRARLKFHWNNPDNPTWERAGTYTDFRPARVELSAAL